MLYFSLAPLFFGCIAIAFFILGVRGLLTKRPFLFPARWMFGLVVLCFAPGLILPFQTLFSVDPMMLLLVLMYAILLIFMWRQFSGYIVFGVTDDSFHTALHHALNALNLPFQETLSRIRLLSLDTDVQAAVQGWMGIAQLRMKQSKHADTLREIASGMTEHFATNHVALNSTTGIFYVIFGILMLVFAIMFGVATANLR